MRAGNTERGVRGLLVAALLLIMVATLSPGALTSNDARPAVWCWACSPNGGSDFVLNVGLFVPCGVALGLLAISPAKSWLAGASLALLIESMQYAGIPAGRVANVTDLIANSAGCLLGGLIGTHWHDLTRPNRRQARGFAIASALCTAGLLGFCGWALAPNTRLLNPNVAALGPDRLPFATKFGWYHGVLTNARVNEGAITATDNGPRSIEIDNADSLSGVATVAGRDERPGLVPFLYVNEPGALPKLLVGQRGRDLQLQASLNAARLRMGSPILTLDDAFVVSDADIRMFRFSVTPSRWRVTLSHAEPSRVVSLDISLGLGWTLFQTVLHAGSTGTQPLSMVWMFLLWFPSGFWCVMADARLDAHLPKLAQKSIGNIERRGFVTGVVLLMVLTLWLVPLVAGIGATSPPEWLLSIAGLAAGVLFAKRPHNSNPLQ